ncbi:MAG TPA: ASPIC/UnbV domain-containing protein, partial [Gemmatimonadota bacterium]|nr:ASPIC/UnbV domain-containing protein [Gemmatimonadota bacterium]
GAAGHWLVVELEGRTSNRSGIGATIEVTADVDGSSRRQVRVVTSRTSWRAAGPLARHFGLGTAERVDEIRVSWPSGRVDTLRGPIAVDRRLTLVEGEARPR